MKDGRSWVAVVVFLGSVALGGRGSAQAAAELLHVQGDGPGDRFGAAVAGAGDVDDDGCGDVLVGIPRADGVGGLAGAGGARLVSGAGGTLLMEWNGNVAHGRLGSAVTGAGDLDGDGVPDLVLGAPQGGATAAGEVWGVSGASGAALWTAQGSAAGERFGASLAAVGDVNLDGVVDLVVGVPHADGAATNAGEVRVLSGDDGTVLFTFPGAAFFDFFGTAVAGPGDVDGDGRPDVLVGTPFADLAAFNGGRASVLSGADGSLLLGLDGTTVGDQLGTWVAGAGDVDGDGLPDLAVGLPGGDAAGFDAGTGEVRSGQDGSLVLQGHGFAPGEFSGLVAGPGDVDGDGRDDLLVGCPSATAGGAPQAGRVRLLSGATGTEVLVLDGTGAQAWFGAALAGLGDVDGDGAPDFAVGAPGNEDVLGFLGHVKVFAGAGGTPGRRHRHREPLPLRNWR